MLTWLTKPYCMLCVLAIVSSSCLAADLSFEVIDSITVHERTVRQHALRSSEYGVTLSTVDPSDPAQSIIHVYTRTSIQRRRLPLFRVQQSALHRDTLYCAMYNSDSTGSLAIVTPDNVARSTYNETGRFFMQSQATSVTVVDGIVAVSDEKYGILILKPGDDTLRYCDRKGNSWMNVDNRECFFLHDTTFWINQALREISFHTGERSTTDVGMNGRDNISIVDDSVRWMDVLGRCHSHAIHSVGRATWTIDTSLFTGCVGRHGVLSEIYQPLTHTYRTKYRSFTGAIHDVIPYGNTSLGADTYYTPFGWYDSGFYQAVRINDTTMIVLRLQEPDPSTSSVPDMAQRTSKRHDVRCLSLSETRLLLEELRRADPATYCVDLLGTRLESSPLTAGPLIFVSGNETRVILVLPW
jgi:hypothetical protein